VANGPAKELFWIEIDTAIDKLREESPIQRLIEGTHMVGAFL
jgi:hypothetical protein